MELTRASVTRLAAMLALAVLLGACGSSSPRAAPPSTSAGAGGSTGSSGPGSTRPSTSAPLPEPTVVASGLAVPWGIAFLPDGDALIASRDTGAVLRLPRGGRPTEVTRIPGVVATGEGGLLGLAVSPRYASDHLVFAYFTTADDNRVARFALGGDLDVILTGINQGPIHDGGRLAFGPDGKLYVTTGDAGNRAQAQDRSSLNGKILRINPDGSIPADNPFAGSPVYSYGHRNVEGLAWDANGKMWAAELGENTWDELNVIRSGQNYGWPEVEGRGPTGNGRFVNPVAVWPTADASPSGLAYWRGALYMAGLRGEALWRIPLTSGGIDQPEALLRQRYGRLRTVVAAPDGSLWVTTSNTDGRGEPRRTDDRVLRFAPN